MSSTTLEFVDYHENRGVPLVRFVGCYETAECHSLLIIHYSLFCALKPLLLEYLLFVGYLVLFAWLVTKTKFFNRSGLSKAQLVIIFLLKVMAGILYGWV